MSGWKRVERKVASLIGGRRIPVTGRARGDAPDVAHPWLSVEVKDRKSLPTWLLDAMRQARASAQDGQLPIAILHQVGQRYDDSLVIVKLSDFADWFVGPTKDVA